MTRLTPKKVLAAFKKHKMLPVQQVFLTYDGACCGLTAAVGVPEQRSYGKTYGKTYCDTVMNAARRRGWSYLYTDGFIDGWDGNRDCAEHSVYQTGYTDGKAAWKLCKKELL